MAYNGWTNYETWLVNLWINNYKDKSREARDLARGVVESVTEVPKHLIPSYSLEEYQAYRLVDTAKDWVNDWVHKDLGASGVCRFNVGATPLVVGLGRGALCEVDWGMIVGYWLEEVRECS